MRSARRFALGVLVALVAGELAAWALTHRPDLVRLARPILLAVLGALLAARPGASAKVALGAALGGGVVLEEAYLLLYGMTHDRWHFAWERLANGELLLLAVARGFGVFLAARGAPRAIDGLLLAMPVVVAEFLLTFVSSLRALGEHFSVGAVTPHLGEVLGWGAAVAVILPLVAGRGGQRA